MKKIKDFLKKIFHVHTYHYSCYDEDSLQRWCVDKDCPDPHKGHSFKVNSLWYTYPYKDNK